MASLGTEYDTMLDQIKKKLRKLWNDRRSYPKRLGISFAVMLGLCFTFLFFGPLEIVAFSGGSLVFTYHDVIWLLLAAMAVTLAVTAPLLALLRGRLFNYAVTGLCSATLSGYLQALLLNGGLGLLTGDAIDWSAHAGSMWLSLLLWALVLAALLLVMYLHRILWAKAVCILSLLLVIMQLVPTVAILFGAYEKAAIDDLSGYHLSDKDLAQLGSENVFVFVLDRLDYDYIEQALRHDPDLFDGMDGFTGYTNAISGYARTRPALTHMLTGAEEYTFRVPSDAYFSQAWTENNILQTLKGQDYSISMYSNIRNLFSDPDFAAEYVDNVTDGRSGMNYGVMLQKLVQLSAFRYAPTALKPFFWADTNYYNTGIYYSDGTAAYQFADAHYASLLKEATAESGKVFRLYHFYGSHAPYNLNADGTASETETTVLDQTLGSFVNLTQIFDRMKELGIYDDATIIITGDHGAAISDLKPLQKATRIGLFYKPAGASGTPLQYSAAPVSVQNIPATIVKATGADHTAFGTPLDEVDEDADITRVYYKTVCDPDTFREAQMYIYEVTGDAADFDNWKHVETVDIPYSYN